MKKLAVLMMLTCVTLAACEPRGTPEKPKMGIAQLEVSPTPMQLASRSERAR